MNFCAGCGSPNLDTDAACRLYGRLLPEEPTPQRTATTDQPSDQVAAGRSSAHRRRDTSRFREPTCSAFRAVHATRRRCDVVYAGARSCGECGECGAFAGAQALRTLMDVGAAGLITGGFVDREITACLGVPADDRLSPWRLGPRDVGMADIGLMATEGFGRLPICPPAFAFLKELEGRMVALLTATRVTGQLSRPQLIAVDEEAIDDEAAPAVATLELGTPVRLVEPTQLGTIGAISAMPSRIRRGDGQMVDVVRVTWPDGKEREVSLANIEIMA